MSHHYLVEHVTHVILYGDYMYFQICELFLPMQNLICIILRRLLFDVSKTLLGIIYI